MATRGDSNNKPECLPIWRDSQRLSLGVEIAVRGLSCYHKYAVGAELRRQAKWFCQILSRALAAKDGQRLKRVEQLVLRGEPLMA